MTTPENFKQKRKFFTNWNLSESVLSKNSVDAGNRVVEETTQAQIPDEKLVIASQRGDTKAFEILIRRYQRQIFNLIYQMTHNVEVVEDIGQEVFVAAFKAIKDKLNEELILID